MLASALAALLLGAPAASYDLGLRTEAAQNRLAPRADGIEPSHRTSADLTLTTGLALEAPRWHLQLGYAPRLWTPKLDFGDAPNLDHRLSLSSEIRPWPSWAIGLISVATRGVLDPLADPWTDFSTTAELFLDDEPQPFESVGAAANVTFRGARTLLRFTTTTNLSRGRNATARRSFPLQGTLNGEIDVGYTASARDQFMFSIEASLSRTCPQECPDGLLTPEPPADAEPGHPYVSQSVYGLSGLQWEHALSPGLDSMLAGGIAFVSEASRDPARTGVSRTALGAEAGLTHREEGSRLTVQIVARYAPDVDRANGRVRQTCSTHLDLGWLASANWYVRWGVAGSTALDREAEVYLASTGERRRPGDPTAIGTQLTAARRIDSGLDLLLGLRWRWQRDTRSTQGSFDEAGLFVALDWALSRARPPQVPPQTGQAQGGAQAR